MMRITIFNLKNESDCEQSKLSRTEGSKKKEGVTKAAKVAQPWYHN